jgi:Protein of unknown function (DUF4197)
MQRLWLIGVLLLVTCAPALAHIEKFLKELPGADTKPAPGLRAPSGTGAASGLSNVQIGSGLKEALKIGTQHAVQSTGRLDGYFANQAINILLPQQLQTVESGVRLVGYGQMVDDLIRNMNRAAEQAAPFALDIFLEAIGAMTFDDVRQILNGGDMAATQYFQTKTTNKLATTFQPIVERKMNEVGVVQQYNTLLGQYQSLPFVKNVTFDLNHYVVDKALAGLFHVVGEEERKIRTNPTARVTDLLQQVFGR